MRESQGPVLLKARLSIILKIILCFLVGHPYGQAIAEFPIPKIVSTTDVSKMNITEGPIQPFNKVLSRLDVSDDINRIGGMRYFFNSGDPYLLINGFEYYSADAGEQPTMFGLQSPSDLENSETDGAYEVKGWDRSSGWISKIPREWQDALGGKWITGHSSGIPIIGRTSVGPSAFVFDPYEIINDSTVQEPISTTEVLGFSLGNPLHDDLHNNSGNNNLWTHLSRATYGFIASGTDTYVTIGKSGGHGPEGVCYKCTDSSGDSCGGYCAPDAEDYYFYYWLWNVNDMAAAKSGEKEPYEVRPYEYGKFPVPFKSDIHPKNRTIKGGTFDSETGRLYLHIKNPYNYQSEYEPPPLILAYSIDTSSSTECSIDSDCSDNNPCTDNFCNSGICE